MGILGAIILFGLIGWGLTFIGGGDDDSAA
jgi:hypothetical protein